MRRPRRTVCAARKTAWRAGRQIDDTLSRGAWAADPTAEGTALTVELGPQRVLELFPRTDLYPPYVADLFRPRFALQLHAASTGIASTGDARFDLRLGGRFGLLRVHPRDRPDRGWQLELIAGYDAQFDIDRSYDNIGWDGNYGLALTTARGRGLAWKLSVFHTSSHVGDEYAERTGRRRIDYTREEVTAGVSWAFAGGWRTYAEAGWAYNLRNEELMEPGRAQAGLEHERPGGLWGGRLGWYAAVDLSATEERDWQVDVSAQAGLLFRPGTRRWRTGLAYHDGRVPLGEFVFDDERYLTFGLWLDL